MPIPITYGAGGILRSGDLVLVVRNHPTWAATPFWSFPGGTVEAHETPVEAMRREVLEESGLTAGAATLAWSTHVVRHAECDHGVIAYFTVHDWTGELVDDDVAQSSSDPRWVDPEEALRLIVDDAPPHSPHIGEPLLAHFGRSDLAPRPHWNYHRTGLAAPLRVD